MVIDENQLSSAYNILNTFKFKQSNITPQTHTIKNKTSIVES